MTAADELRTAAASIRAGDMPADPEKFLEAVADLFDTVPDTGTSSITYHAAAAVARAWNADLP